MLLKLILILLLLICAYTDIRRRKIYNLVLLPALVLGFGLNMWPTGLTGFLDSLWGMFLGGGLLLIPYLLGGMGAGDVKLLAAVGAIGGAAMVWRVFIFTALAGGLLAIIAAVRNGNLWLTLLKAVNPKLSGKLKQQTKAATIPYGLAIAIGGLTALFLG